MLHLNVGGEVDMSLTRELLTSVQGSLLQKMFSGDHPLNIVDNKVFIDRDAQHFKSMISYLRSDREIYPEFESPHDDIWFSKELKYWGIPNSNFESKSILYKLPRELVEYLQSEPKNVKPEPLDKWKELGPIDLLSIIMQASDDNPVNFKNKFGKSEKNFSFDIQGQLDPAGKTLNGLGRSNYRNIIYEGQFVNDSWHGLGRAIFQDGRYHYGFWKKDRRNGPGKTVRFDKKTKRWIEEEGYWENDVLKKDNKIIADWVPDIAQEKWIVD